MKKAFFNSIGLFFLFFSAKTGAQSTLYGLTSAGGANGSGSIVKVGTNGTGFVNAYSFENGGRTPTSELVLASNGKYYGVTSAGGPDDVGTLYEYDPATSTQTVKFNFSYAAGVSLPSGGLVEYNGKLYGCAAIGYGMIYEFDPATSAVVVRHTFPSAWNTPIGSLTVFNSKLYGTTASGGFNGGGVLFELDPNGWVFTVKHHLAVATGAAAYGNMVVYNTKLYGMAFHNGTSGNGTLFSFEPATNTFATLQNLSNSTGGFAFGGLLLHNAILYGTTGYGGSNNLGALFSYNPATSTYSNLYSFSAASGSVPSGTLIQTGGKLYGTTYAGGTNAAGTIFEFNPTGNTHTVLRHLSQNSDGAKPQGELIVGMASGCTITPTIAGTTTICAGQSTTLTASGGTTYVWSNGTTTAANTVSPTTSTTYTVTATNANGCTATAAATVTVASAFTISVTGTKPACFGGSDGTAKVTPTGSTTLYTYLWSNGATTSKITGLAAGNFTVTVTDSKGCTATASATVNTPPELVLTHTLSALSNGKYKVELAASGGTPYTTSVPYRYCKVNANGGCSFSTTTVFSNLAAGTTFEFRARDKNAYTDVITVTTPGTLTGGGTDSGKAKIQSNAAFSLFPNPFESSFALSATGTSEQLRRVQIFDLTGRRVAENEWPTGSAQLQIQSDDRPAGLYMVKIVAADGSILAVLRAVKS